MLRDDVVEAVRTGQFHIWAAEEVDDALELLTGLPGGKADAAGEYPQGSVHRAVSERLAKYAETLKALSAGEERKPEEGPGGNRAGRRKRGP
ncbi:MAG: hypothetical protein HY236_14565, partial [Acidobacteria bacterium]|nr:hypothetical protein [Acidobacteriota bacterium]